MRAAARWRIAVPCALSGVWNSWRARWKRLCRTACGCGRRHHAATMTGELADLFADRDEGVRQIVRR